MSLHWQGSARATLLSFLLGCSGTTTTAAPPLVEHPAAATPAVTVSEAAFEKQEYQSRDLLLGPVRAYGGVWFAKERYPVADALADLFARPEYGGYDVIPVAQVRSLIADTQEGKLPGQSQVCTSQPPPQKLLEFIFEGASTAEIEIRCEDTECELLVTLQSEKGKEPVHRAISLPAALSPKQWSEMIVADGLPLVTPEPVYGGVMGYVRDDKAPGVYAELEVAHQSGTWKNALTTDAFQPYAKDLYSCERSEHVWRDFWSQNFLVEVDEKGTLKRCEYSESDHLPPPAFACQCKVLERIDFAPSTTIRRASFRLDLLVVKPQQDRPAISWSISSASVVASDRTATLGRNPLNTKGLYECVEPLDKAGSFSIPVEFEIGVDGRVVRHKARFPGHMSSEIATCMDKALVLSRFNCPLSGTATISTELKIRSQ